MFLEFFKRKEKNITYYIFSDKGNREINEDSVGFSANDCGKCFVLCDGLGGHGMGDIASQLVVKVFENQFKNTPDNSAFLPIAFEASQDLLLAEQIKRKCCKKMKTTATAVVCDNKNAYIGHIGDSRVYIFNNNKVLKRTKDHSVPQMLVLTGEITEDEIRNHPDRSIILKVLGVEWDDKNYELMKPLPLKKCQAFLLCSDGFWELIHENVMSSLLSESKSPKEWILKMVDIVEENGKGINMDNFSAIGIWVE